MVVPIASIGALSQAWFDALGLARPKELGAATKPINHDGQAPRAAKAPLATGKSDVVAAPRQSIGESTTSRQSLRSRFLIAARFEHVRKIRLEKQIAQTRDARNDVQQRSAGRITIRARQGAIRMLVQRDGAQMKITAVCDPALVGRVHDALASARIRLGARGIALEIATHEEPTS